MEPEPREIRRYLTSEGRIPFAEWLESLKDLTAVVKVEQRLDRVRLGNLGNCRSVGEGVFELKVDYGPGYRVYFGQDEVKIILLLCDGDKSTQKQDIRKAKAYWEDYERRKDLDE